LWNLPAVQTTYANRGGKYAFPDNMDYFFGRVVAVMAENYEPTVDDVLKGKVLSSSSSSAMIEYVYEFKEDVFTIYHVSNQNQNRQRKKWIHCFEDVTAVLFVVALDHYHAVSFEDETKNAMHEAIEFWTEICNSNNKWFRKSEMIVLFNKEDLFREKLRDQISLSECFSAEAGWQVSIFNCIIGVRSTQ
jgi:hypothetical protein